MAPPTGFQIRMGVSTGSNAPHLLKKYAGQHTEIVEKLQTHSEISKKSTEQYIEDLKALYSLHKVLLLDKASGNSEDMEVVAAERIKLLHSFGNNLDHSVQEHQAILARFDHKDEH